MKKQVLVAMSLAALLNIGNAFAAGGALKAIETNGARQLEVSAEVMAAKIEMVAASNMGSLKLSEALKAEISSGVSLTALLNNNAELQSAVASFIKSAKGSKALATALGKTNQAGVISRIAADSFTSNGAATAVTSSVVADVTQGVSVNLGLGDALNAKVVTMNGELRNEVIAAIENLKDITAKAGEGKDTVIEGANIIATVASETGNPVLGPLCKFESKAANVGIATFVKNLAGKKGDVAGRFCPASKATWGDNRVEELAGMNGSGCAVASSKNFAGCGAEYAAQ